ncbi:MAG: hypothetical protein KJ983_05035, partial [Candidatus Omnitrophica bacterium]|nr:hypothetical protein [Candidatus Omnitrophota bacterium]
MNTNVEKKSVKGLSSKGKITIGVTVAMLVLIVVLMSCSLFFKEERSSTGFANPTNVTITQDATWTSNAEILGTLTIQSGVTLTIDSRVAGVALMVSATNLVVEEDACISMDGKGLSGGDPGFAGSGLGKGLAGGKKSGAGGAGYGGAGGDGEKNVG